MALSFAGVQSHFVEQVAPVPQARRVRCFYDADEQLKLGEVPGREIWRPSMASSRLRWGSARNAGAAFAVVGADWDGCGGG